MPSALFETPFADGQPTLPTNDETGYEALFDGPPVQGWCIVADGTLPTVTVLITTSADQIAAHKANGDLLWLADVGSPIHDAPVTAQGANAAVNWLKDNGYSGAEFGQAIATIQSARSRRALAAGVAGLHGVGVAELERPGIG